MDNGVALITKIKEGSNDAESYTIEKRPGEFVKVIIDNKDLAVGDCVAIEEGSTTNLRKVADDMCGTLVTAEIEEELNNDEMLNHCVKEPLFLTKV